MIENKEDEMLQNFKEKEDNLFDEVTCKENVASISHNSVSSEMMRDYVDFGKIYYNSERFTVVMESDIENAYIFDSQTNEKIPYTKTLEYFKILTQIEKNTTRIGNLNLALRALIEERIDNDEVMLSINMLLKKLYIINKALLDESYTYVNEYPTIRDYIKCKHPTHNFSTSEPMFSNVNSLAAKQIGIIAHDFQSLYPNILPIVDYPSMIR